MPRPRPARFTARLVRLDEGLRHHIVPIPDAVAATFKAAKTRRVLCTFNGHTIRRAIQNHADGGSFILLGQPHLRDFGLKSGAHIAVELRADPNPDALDIPEEFAVVLAQDPETRARWETFTVGFRRSLLYYVSSAKQEPTRIKRALELAHKIRTRSLHNDR